MKKKQFSVPDEVLNEYDIKCHQMLSYLYMVGTKNNGLYFTDLNISDKSHMLIMVMAKMVEKSFGVSVFVCTPRYSLWRLQRRLHWKNGFERLREEELDKLGQKVLSLNTLMEIFSPDDPHYLARIYKEYYE